MPKKKPSGGRGGLVAAPTANQITKAAANGFKTKAPAPVGPKASAKSVLAFKNRYNTWANKVKEYAAVDGLRTAINGLK